MLSLKEFKEVEIKDFEKITGGDTHTSGGHYDYGYATADWSGDWHCDDGSWEYEDLVYTYK